MKTTTKDLGNGMWDVKGTTGSRKWTWTVRAASATEAREKALNLELGR